MLSCAAMKNSNRFTLYAVLIPFIVWRILLFISAFAGILYLPFTPRFPYSEALLIPSGLPGWVWTFANFDGVHYLTIASSSYSAQFTQVFFPLYPLSIRIIHGILQMRTGIIPGILISNVCFLISMRLLYGLVTRDFNRSTGIWSLLFLLVFPTSFFFGSLYTESLFFMLTVGAFYASRLGKWRLAGILGAFASATRLHGIFLFPALLWERFEYLKQQKSFTPVSLIRSPLLLIPAGLISYMVYLQMAFGDALYFWHAQPVFGAQRSGDSIILLPQVVWRYIKILFSIPFGTETFWIPAAEMGFTFLCLLILVLAHRLKIRLSYLIFSWISVILPTMTGTFSSMPRYVLVAFPMYIVLAKIPNLILRSLLAAGFLVLLVVFTILFTRGHWVS